MSKRELVVWAIIFILSLVFGGWMISNNQCINPDGCGFRNCEQGDDHLAAWGCVVLGIIGIIATTREVVMKHREK